MKKTIFSTTALAIFCSNVFAWMPLLPAPDNNWTRKADLSAINNMAVAFGIAGKGYIGTGMGQLGGFRNDFWEYDPAADSWTQKADFGGTARARAVGFSIGSKGYVGTGDADGIVNKDFWEYDPASNRWTRKADFGGTARVYAVGFSIGGRGYIGTGGIINGSIRDRDFWEFNPHDLSNGFDAYGHPMGKWTKKADFGGTARYGAVGFSIGSKGYIGTGDGNGFRKDFWEYDPSSDTWTQKSDFGDTSFWPKGQARVFAVGFSIGNRGYIGTGQIAAAVEKDFWEYNPVSNSWTLRNDFGGLSRASAVGFSIGDKGYIGTGNFIDFWEFTPGSQCFSDFDCFDNNDCTDDLCISGICRYNDLFPTSITCPADIIVNPDPGICYASSIVLSSASPVFINCTKATLSASPLSFPTGITDVSWSLTDNNNTLSCTQRVTVIPNCDPSLQCCADGDDCTTDICETLTGCDHQAVGTTTYYADSDNDGYGNAAVSSTSCTQPSGYVANSDDCDDTNPFVHPSGNGWIQKVDFGGVARDGAVAFSIGGNGYIGCGQQYGIGPLRDFWEYNPATDSWTQKADFGGVARAEAVGFSIGNKGYVGTGFVFPGVAAKDFWEYDPSTNTWVQKADVGGLIAPGREKAVGFGIGAKGYIGVGRVTAGPGPFLSDFWEYNPAIDSWTQKANYGGTAMYDMVGFSIANKGYIGVGNNKEFWEYDPVSNIWSRKADYGGSAITGAVGFSISGKGYVGTGDPNNDLWEYKPGADTWVQKEDFPGIDRFNAVAFSIGNKGYFATGSQMTFVSLQKDFWEYEPVVTETCNGVDDNCDGVVDENTTCADGEFCTIDACEQGACISTPIPCTPQCCDDSDPSTLDYCDNNNCIHSPFNVWEPVSDDFDNINRAGAISFSMNGYGYVGTGKNIDDGAYLNDLWRYDPVANSWTEMDTLPGPRREQAICFVIGSNVYIGTGSNTSGNLNDFYKYVPSTGLWQSLDVFDGSARHSAVAFTVNGSGYISTGMDNTGRLKDVWQYNEDTDAWTQKNDFQGSARLDAVAFTISNKAYLGTGDGPSGRLNDFWEYNSVTDGWTARGNFNGTARASAVGLAAIYNRGYIIAGLDDNSARQDLWEYSPPPADSWTLKADMPGLLRYEATGFIIGEKAYVGTGYLASPGARLSGGSNDFFRWSAACPDCDDINQCTLNLCDGNNCAFPNIDCDDGDACTTDSCSNGVCTHSCSAATESIPAIQWQKALGGTGTDVAKSIEQTNDGGYVIAGSTSSNDGDVTGNHGNNDYWIVKLDTSGTILWQKALGGTNDEYAYSIRQTNDGGYVIAGYTLSNDGDVTGNHGGEDYGIIKLDASGTILWQKALGGTGVDEATSIRQTNDGGYVIAGSTSSNDGDVTGNHGDVESWIVRLDPSGNIQWQKALGGTGTDEAKSIEQTNDGGYVIAGYTSSNDGDVNGNHGGLDSWIVKLAANPLCTPCDDGDACTVDSCVGSGCSHTAYVCNDNNSCTADQCGATGCVFTEMCVTLAADEVTTDPGAQVVVPVRVRNFGGIITMQGALKFDPSIISFVQAEQFGLPRMNASDIGTSMAAAGTLLFSWNDSAMNGVTVADDHIIFALRFDVTGVRGQQSPVDFSDTLAALEVYDSTLNPRTVLTDNGKVFIRDTVISGAIVSELGDPVPTVTVDLDGSQVQSLVTGNDGRYEFNVQGGGDYTVTPSKTNDNTANNGITTLDIVLMQRHILYAVRLSSPYKIIAADCNGSGTVTTIDIIYSRRIILAIASSYPNGRLWKFVPDDYVFANPDNPFPFPASRTYANITGSEEDQDFIGIKIGDVNNSWNPNVSRLGTVGDVRFMMGEYHAENGDEVTVPVRVKDFKDIAGYQFTLSWDKGVLMLKEVSDKSLNGYYGESQINRGLLTTSWYDEQGGAVSLHDDVVAFELRFKVIGENGSFSAIQIGSDPTNSEAYNNQLDLLNIIPANGMVQVGKAISRDAQTDDCCDLRAIPNPFSDRLNIEFKLPQDSRVKLEVFNIAGQRLAMLFEGNVNAGEMQTVEYMPTAVSDVMIFYRLQTEQGGYYGKAVMVR